MQSSSEERALLSKSVGEDEGQLGNNSLDEPPAWLSAIGGIGIVLFGTSGMSLPRALQATLHGDLWYHEQLKILLELHVLGIVFSAFAARSIVPKLRHILLESKLHDNANHHVEHRWDTLKWTLTMLVSLTHFSHVFDGYVWREIYGTFKDFFLMQTYMFVSGYLSPPVPTRRRLRAVWKSVVGTYIVNQLLFWLLVKIAYKWGPAGRLYVTFRPFTRQEVASKNLFYEFWMPFAILYYLADLIMARIIAPVWVELRYPLLASFIMAVCIQYIPHEYQPTFFALVELFALLPYYMLGISIKRNATAFSRVMEWRSTRIALAAAFCCFFSLTVVSYGMRNSLGFYAKQKHSGWFDAYQGKEGFAYGELYSGTAFCFAFYDTLGGAPLRILMVFAAISLFGGGHHPLVLNLGLLTFSITRQGKNSIANYIMHYYAKFALAFTPLFEPTHYSPWKVIGIFVLV